MNCSRRRQDFGLIADGLISGESSYPKIKTCRGTGHKVASSDKIDLQHGAVY